MKNSRSRLYRQLLTATLLFGGTFNLVAPAMADGTAAGTEISNTATGTYFDPSDPNTQINTTSNTVKIKVAEVAGIDVSANNTPGSANPGGTLNYDFKITNTGNDPTKFKLPSQATLTDSNNATSNSGTVTSITYSTDPTFANGNVTITPSGAPVTTASVDAGKSIYVRVVVTVAANATGSETIKVEYGKTADPTKSNQDYVADGTGNNALDLYTEDNADNSGVTGEVSGTPVNTVRVREDSATLTGTVGTVAGVLNGPKDHADAVGANNDNNKDFTEKSYAVPASKSPEATDVDPTGVSFTNTLLNNSNASQTYTIQPTVPAGSNLPSGTEVTVTDATNKSVKYTLTNGVFAVNTPLTITVPKGQTANYTVKVDLPSGTLLSTDLTTPGDLDSAKGGYSVPIVAYVDQGTTGLDASDPQNTTIDTVYVGYLALYKDARILDSNGTEVQGYTTDQDLLGAKFQPGNIVEYRIRYKNIAPNVTGATNSSSLTAKTVTIIEDGTKSNSNWALDNDKNGTIDTSDVAGKAADTLGKTVTPTTQNGNVIKYEDAVGDLTPQQSGTFTIQRKIN